MTTTATPHNPQVLHPTTDSLAAEVLQALAKVRAINSIRRELEPDWLAELASGPAAHRVHSLTWHLNYLREQSFEVQRALELAVIALTRSLAT